MSWNMICRRKVRADLIVLSDIVCYLGWLYSFFDVGWLVSQLFAATRLGGRCLFANAMGDFGDMLLLPWLIYTYRDLFRNVGYRTEIEEVFRVRSTASRSRRL